MKLSRLESTTQSATREATERARESANSSVRRVEAMEGVAPDRERSLHQELAEFDPRAVGPFDGQDLILANARQLADQLLKLGPELRGLCQLSPASVPKRIDDEV